MNETEPPLSTQTDRERQAIAELLGRILAAYWLSHRRPLPDPAPAKRTEKPR
jgi:hypothetical protein